MEFWTLELYPVCIIFSIISKIIGQTSLSDNITGTAPTANVFPPNGSISKPNFSSSHGQHVGQLRSCLSGIGKLYKYCEADL